MRSTSGVGTSTSSRTSRVAVRRGYRTVVCQAQNVFDHSIRVKGDYKRVFTYVGDFANLPAWYPGVTSSKKLRGDTVTLKTQFAVERLIYNWTHNSTYEVVEYEAGRKITYSATSELHTATHSLYFMADPTDRTFTNIRYLKKFQLRNLALPLQPFVSGLLKGLPEQALQNLARSLNRPDTPLRFIRLDPQEEAELAAEERRLRNAARGAAGGWSSFQSFFDGLTSGSSMDSSDRPTAPSHASASASLNDVLGYYQVLGLDGSGRVKYSAEDIKAAYRRTAMDLHPDKFASKDEGQRIAAQATFQKLQKAYAILKEPSQKALYDSGKILSDMVV